VCFAKLKGRVREVYGTDAAFAQAMGISKAAMSMRLNNKCQWSVEDVRRAINLLNIPETEIGVYFFASEVPKNGTESHKTKGAGINV
jgi:hypothetical protein